MSATPVLQLDLGNSRLKWRLMAAGEVLARGAADAAAAAWAELPAAPAAVQVASVADEAAELALAAGIREQWSIEPWFARTSARAGSLVNSYAEPERMGVDRWLAMLGARARCRERLCVVDAGSALTIDLVAADGQHEGGYILPGAVLMARSLTQDTQRVRFGAAAAPSLVPGRSTDACVHHGIALAQAGALALALREAARHGPRPRLLACGGGAAELLRCLEEPHARHCEDLVFEGLSALADPP